jgi:hypothetical protein
MTYLSSVYSFRGRTFPVLQSAWRKTVVAGIVTAFVLAGCSAQEVLEEIDDSAPVVEVPEEVAADVPRHPLTGEEIAAGSITGPAIMAKVDHENRPYVALHRADQVWQQVIPQNGTRFLPVWHSDVPDAVAYVRSFRPHDYTMASPYGGILASTGLFQGVVPYLDALTAAGVQNVVWDYRGPEDRDLWRNTGKPYAAASSVEFAAKAAQQQFSTLAPPQQYFNYVSDPAETTAMTKGEAATSVIAYFSQSTSNNYMTSSWEWDAAEGVYKKVFVNGDPVLSDSLDWTTGQSCGECVQLTTTNIIAISVEHDDVVGQPTARFTDGAVGPAWVATGGKILKVNWESGAIGVPIKFTDRDGDPVTLAPGKTWILVFPGDASTARTAGWGGAGSIFYE